MHQSTQSTKLAPLPIPEDFVEARRRDMSPCDVAIERVKAEQTRVALYYEWLNGGKKS